MSEIGDSQLLLNRSKFLSYCTFVIVVIPVLMDYFFEGSGLARYSRVLIFIVVGFSLSLDHSQYLKLKFVGTETIILVSSLYVLGTWSAISHGGVFTPNFALLFLFLFISGSNIDCYRNIFKALIYSNHFLVVISLIVIVLKLNPRNAFYPAEGYPVFFDFIGIPGRNYGIYPHPNTLGMAAGFSFIFIISDKISKYWLLIPMLCLVKCGSRTSIIATAICILLFWIHKRLKPDPVVKSDNELESGIAIGTLVFGLFLAATFRFLIFIPTINSGALTGRVSIWQSSLQLFKGNSLIGLGWGYEQRAIDAQLLNVWAVSAHNGLLEIVFSTGIIGLAIFLVTISKGIVNYFRLLVQDRLILVFVLFASISESYIDLQYPTIQTFLVFLIIMCSNRIGEIR